MVHNTTKGLLRYVRLYNHGNVQTILLKWKKARAAAFDISKTFDRIWHTDLHKLKKELLGPVVGLVVLKMA